MNYTSVLKRAWHITWHHRALWVFGILLALFGGGGGSNGGGGGSGNGGPSVQYGINGSDLQRFHLPAGITEAMVIGLIIAVIVFVLVMIVLSIVIGYTARGALIGMVDEVERTNSTSVRSGFRAGWARFLHLFAIGLATGVPAAIAVLALLFILVAPPVGLVILFASQHSDALAAVTGIAAILLFLLWLLVTIVGLAVLELLVEFMYRRCVLEREGVLESVRQGYHMVRRNLRDVGLAWLILFGIRLGFSIVTVPVAIILLGLVAAPGFAAWALTRSIVAALVAALPLFLVFIAAMVVVEGIYLVFQSAVWTLVYREIMARGRGAEAGVIPLEPAEPGEGSDPKPEQEGGPGDLPAEPGQS